MSSNGKCVNTCVTTPGTRCLIGVGSGLGVAMVSRGDDGRVTVLPTEAGHCHFMHGVPELEPVPRERAAHHRLEPIPVAGPARERRPLATLPALRLEGHELGEPRPDDSVGRERLEAHVTGLRQPALVAESARVVAGLNRDGVAMTSVSALLGPTSCFDELSAEIARLQKSLQDRIAAARSLADTSEIEIGKKTFLLQYLDDNPALYRQSIGDAAHFASQPDSKPRFEQLIRELERFAKTGVIEPV